MHHVQTFYASKSYQGSNLVKPFRHRNLVKLIILLIWIGPNWQVLNLIPINKSHFIVFFKVIKLNISKSELIFLRLPICFSSSSPFHRNKTDPSSTVTKIFLFVSLPMTAGKRLKVRRSSGWLASSTALNPSKTLIKHHGACVQSNLTIIIAFYSRFRVYLVWFFVANSRHQISRLQKPYFLDLFRPYLFLL